MVEVWRNIEGFLGYQVSSEGRVRTFWKRKHRSSGYGCDWVLNDTPSLMSLSDDGNGYLKVMLYNRNDGKRYCKKIHRLVAEAFIPKPQGNGEYTVDHIRSGPEGKLDNSIRNLRWILRRENIQKAYRDGMCDERIRKSQKPIIAVDLWTDREFYFNSIKEAAYELNLDRSSISHVLIGDIEKTSHYTFEYAGREEKLLYGSEEYNCYQRISGI